MEEGEINNFIKVSFSVLTFLSYCYFISSKISKGKFRLLSLLPVIIFFIILPTFFSYLFPIAIASVFISWLANFKLLLFAFDQGPLSCDPPKSLIQFIAIATLPIKINQNTSYPFSKIPHKPQHSPTEPPKLPLNWSTKVSLCAILIGVHDYIMDHLHPKLVLVLYCCMAYLLVDIVFGAANAMVHAILHMELERPSAEPYLSTSLQDFWGRRWNLMISDLLRHTVYRPVRLTLDTALGQWSPLAGVFAAFVVSGLMHELLTYHITRVPPTWEMTCFFVFHGVCVLAEFCLKRKIGRDWQLHWVVSGPLTVGFVVVTAMWLFFPPLIRVGAAEEAIGECKMFNYVKERLEWIIKV